MIAINTAVFVLAFAFHQDARQGHNTRFLELLQAKQPLITIYSVMEVLGQLSFNLAPARLRQWPTWLQAHYGLTVVYPPTNQLTAELFFQQEFIDQPLARMQQLRIPFVDGLILGLIEPVAGIEAFVTWNARHYRGKTALTVLTPNEYLGQ